MSAPPPTDPRTIAAAYLENNSILPLFTTLGTKLMFTKPSDPNQFLIDTLKSMQQEKKEEGFFNLKDIQTMFSVFDRNNTGFITDVQYRSALESLGVTEPKERMEGKKVGKEVFYRLVMKELESVKKG